MLINLSRKAGYGERTSERCLMFDHLVMRRTSELRIGSRLVMPQSRRVQTKQSARKTRNNTSTPPSTINQPSSSFTPVMIASQPQIPESFEINEAYYLIISSSGLFQPLFIPLPPFSVPCRILNSLSQPNSNAIAIIFINESMIPWQLMIIDRLAGRCNISEECELIVLEIEVM